MPDKFFRSVLPGELRELPKIDTSVAHIARVYDYWLGGKDNFAIDRERRAVSSCRAEPGDVAARGLVQGLAGELVAQAVSVTPLMPR